MLAIYKLKKETVRITGKSHYRINTGESGCPPEHTWTGKWNSSECPCPLPFYRILPPTGIIIVTTAINIIPVQQRLTIILQIWKPGRPGFKSATTLPVSQEWTTASTNTSQLGRCNKGNTRHLRPTLYDLLVQEALKFFESGDIDINNPVYTFELDQADALKLAGISGLYSQTRDSFLQTQSHPAIPEITGLSCKRHKAGCTYRPGYSKTSVRIPEFCAPGKRETLFQGHGKYHAEVRQTTCFQPRFLLYGPMVPAKRRFLQALWR